MSKEDKFVGPKSPYGFSDWTKSTGNLWPYGDWVIPPWWQTVLDSPSEHELRGFHKAVREFYEPEEPCDERDRVILQACREAMMELRCR